MKEIRKTSQFKKDYKRFSKDLNKVKLLFSIVEKLAKGEDIPSEFKPHQLRVSGKTIWNVTLRMIISLFGTIKKKTS